VLEKVVDILAVLGLVKFKPKAHRLKSVLLKKPDFLAEVGLFCCFGCSLD
jgi:hypothetical protein